IDFRHVIGKTGIEPKRPRGGGAFPAARKPRTRKTAHAGS
ncbi:XRE family transcriptional regulator, partial [Burkholderia pseudomallei]|nr:XRE family transcriptional regulator [Burkholderia pseudomallei]